MVITNKNVIILNAVPPLVKIKEYGNKPNIKEINCLYNFS